MSEAEIIHDAEVIGTEVQRQLDNLPAVKQATAIIARDEISVAEVVAQHDKIVQVMQAVMKPDVHYGIIPGVRNPSLFKAGAETINVALRLAPHYDSDKIWHDDGHLTVTVVCTLKHIPTGLEVATGEGLCSSRESRYAFRQGGRVCPDCGKDTIIRGKAEYGGGWICFAKKGGCGNKWADGTEQASAFENTDTGRVDNPDLADTFNTVLKMADKRALVAAVLNGTAASDVFTQDVEDGGVVATPQEPPERRMEGPPPLPVPKSWAKLTEMVGAYDAQVNEWFTQFVRSAVRYLFAPAQEPKDLKAKADKDRLFQVAAGAAIHLREQFDPNEIPPPGLEDVRGAFALVLDVELAIPEEQLDSEAVDAAEREA